MSITTRRGDGGETDLMYGRRVAKSHPRVAACGDADELNATLGLARAHSQREHITQALAARQQDLVALMGELATEEADAERYIRDQFPRITSAHVDHLTDEAAKLEQTLQERFNDWATPGAETTPCGAALDLARTVCRRAERAVVTLAPANLELIRYLNRLSDYLWLLARWESKLARPDSPGAQSTN